MITLLIMILSIRSISSFPSILIDPDVYPKSDMIIHDFRQDFHPNYVHRCLLQNESKYFYLNPSCQLITRLSLRPFCSLISTFRLEIALSGNTTVYEITIQSNGSNCKKKKTTTNNHQCQFEKNPYRIKLKENQIYKHFLHIQTFPSCLGSNYSLSSTNSKKNLELFSLNSSTGYLSLLHPLDYELSTTWKLVIQAHDMYQIPIYTYVIIDVDDVNDCPPLLSWNFPLQTIQRVNETDLFHLEISIDESKVEHGNIIIANLIASDLDSPLEFDLKINSSQSVPFTIDGPYGDSTYVLLTNAKLDREYEEQYILQLILADHGQPPLISSYELIINILDSNDNPPKFEQDIYFVDIQENNSLNTTLIQLVAKDADLDDNGRVTYELDDQGNDYVWIDNRTGTVRAKKQFDYEKLTNFSFNVTARDHPKSGRQFRTSVLVIVTVLNLNDNLPKFAQSTYEFSIQENNSPHVYIGQVTATDADNTSLTYTFENLSDHLSSLFYLSPLDGRIYALQSFDREQLDQYLFYIIASDGYHISLPIEVHVKILDLNDELPRFIFPNANNDTLIIDRTYWNPNDHICQIEIQDLDQIQTYTLLLIYRLDQLKNYDYLIPKENNPFQFDSLRFFLDAHSRLFFNTTNGTSLNEGVYYLAFKIVDQENYSEEKLLKLIVVNDYEHVQNILQQYDHLGLHLNNRSSYFHYSPSSSFPSSSKVVANQTSKYLLLIIFSILIIILSGITFLFVSLIRRQTFKAKQSNSSPSPSKKPNLHISNCYDYNDAALLMLNKDLQITSTMMNDHCSLLETIHEKDSYDQTKNKIYSSWMLSRADSHRSTDSSTFQSFNHISLPSTHIANELCSPKHYSTLPPSSDYTVAIVSSPTANISSNTPVSSDDGFCGSSDTSDPSIPLGNHSLYQPYLMMKDGIRNKTSSTTNGTDSTRRVRFNLQSASHLRQLEDLYVSKEEILERKLINSTVV